MYSGHESFWDRPRALVDLCVKAHQETPAGLYKQVC